MKELWKAVPDYEGLYEVSNLGQIRNATTYEIKSCKVHSTGRTTVVLYKDGKTKQYRMDSIVAAAFIKKHSKKKTAIKHKDNNEANCCSKNLKWYNPDK